MDNQKMAALLYMGAGITFLISAFLVMNMVFLGLGIYFLYMGIRKLRDAQ